MSRTPILDGEQPPPLRKVRWALGLLIGIALGGLLVALDRARNSSTPLIPPVAFAIFVPAFYIAVFVHESGHLIGAMAADFELRTFMVGSFLFKKEAQGWRFRFVLGHLLWGGRTGIALHSDRDLVKRFIRFVLGGAGSVVSFTDLHCDVTRWTLDECSVLGQFIPRGLRLHPVYCC